MRTAVIILFVMISGLLQAQNTSQVRNITGFTEIDVSTGIKVELTMGNKEHVEVFADEEVIDRIITRLSGEELEIYIKSSNSWFGSNKKYKNIVVKVTAVKIKSLDVSSGARIVTINKIKTDELELDASSGGALSISFEVDKASCETSSGSSAVLKGKTNSIELDASSGSSIKASDVVAQEVDADVSSGASIRITVVSKLKAEASSGGSIKYSGTPKFVDIEKSSGGGVYKQ